MRGGLHTFIHNLLSYLCYRRMLLPVISAVLLLTLSPLIPSPACADDYEILGRWQFEVILRDKVHLPNLNHADIYYTPAMDTWGTYRRTVKIDTEGQNYTLQTGESRWGQDEFVISPPYFLWSTAPYEAGRIYLVVDTFEGNFAGNDFMEGSFVRTLYHNDGPAIEYTGEFRAERIEAVAGSPGGTMPAGGTGTSPVRQAAAGAGAAGVLSMAAYLIHRAQGMPFTNTGRNNARHRPAGEPPRMTGEDGKEYVWYIPKGDMAAEPFWAPAEMYENDRWHQEQGHVFQDNMWHASQADADLHRNWRERPRETWFRPEELVREARREREARIEAYLSGENVELSANEKTMADIQKQINEIRQERIEAKREYVRMREDIAEYDQRMVRHFDRAYRGVKIIGTASDHLISKGATFLNLGKPVGVGTLIEAPYLMTRDVASNLAEDGLSWESVKRNVPKGLMSGAYETATGVAGNYLKVDKMSIIKQMAFNISTELGGEYMFGDGDYDAAVLDAVLDTAAGNTLDKVVGKVNIDPDKLGPADQIDWRAIDPKVRDAIKIKFDFQKEKILDEHLRES